MPVTVITHGEDGKPDKIEIIPVEITEAPEPRVIDAPPGKINVIPVGGDKRDRPATTTPGKAMTNTPKTDPTGYAPIGPLEKAPSGPLVTGPGPRRDAFTAALADVQLGTYDQRVIDWLCDLDDSTCRTVVSLIWRARQAAGTEVTLTERQAVTVKAARKRLDAGISNDLGRELDERLQERIDTLEYQVSALLDLIGELTGGAQ